MLVGVPMHFDGSPPMGPGGTWIQRIGSAERGGLSNQQILTRLLESDNKWAKWGFVGDGLGEAKGRQLYKALFSYEPIEWNRIGAFQVHRSLYAGILYGLLMAI